MKFKILETIYYVKMVAQVKTIEEIYLFTQNIYFILRIVISAIKYIILAQKISIYYLICKDTKSESLKDSLRINKFKNCKN